MNERIPAAPVAFGNQAVDFLHMIGTDVRDAWVASRPEPPETPVLSNLRQQLKYSPYVPYSPEHGFDAGMIPARLFEAGVVVYYAFRERRFAARRRAGHILDLRADRAKTNLADFQDELQSPSE